MADHLGAICTDMPQTTHQLYSKFLSKQLSAPAAFVLSTADIATSCDTGLAILPNRHSQNFRIIAQVCRHVAEMGKRLIIDDAHTHPFFGDIEGATGAGISSYIGAPVKDAQGKTVGVVCVIDSKIRNWTFVELTLLTEIAREIAADWAQRRQTAATKPKPANDASAGERQSGRPARS